MKLDLTYVDPARAIKQLLLAMRKRVTLEDNIQCQIIDIPDTGAALTPFSVLHKLGKVPRAYIANLDKHGSIRDVNRVGWTDVSMDLECSVANAHLVLVVF